MNPGVWKYYRLLTSAMEWNSPVTKATGLHCPQFCIILYCKEKTAGKQKKPSRCEGFFAMKYLCLILHQVLVLSMGSQKFTSNCTVTVLL